MTKDKEETHTTGHRSDRKISPIEYWEDEIDEFETMEKQSGEQSQDGNSVQETQLPGQNFNDPPVIGYAEEAAAVCEIESSAPHPGMNSSKEAWNLESKTGQEKRSSNGKIKRMFNSIKFKRPTRREKNRVKSLQS